MDNVKLTNKRAGTVKLPGGRRIKKGQTLVVPVTALMHRSVRSLITTGRMQVSSLAKRAEQVTDGLIHAARDLVDGMIDNPALEEASDKVLDAVEQAVEATVDSAIAAVSQVAEDALDAAADMLGLGDDDDDGSDKPKKRSRRKSSDA